MGGMNKLDTPIDFMLTRRSVPAKLLTAPAPSEPELRQMLTAAARVPDHGKLEPWRFVVLARAAATRLGNLARKLGVERGVDPDKLEKLANGFDTAPSMVAVLSTPDPDASIPLLEQQLSAGAACLSLVNAALAMGYGANWLTGWIAHDATYLKQSFDLEPPATIAGFIHIGKARAAPPERPRPDLDIITTWLNT